MVAEAAFNPADEHLGSLRRKLLRLLTAVPGTKPTSRNVRCSVAFRGKPTSSRI
jgi:hypothetical protein